MKRSGFAAIVSRFREARARIVWCMVGTAVYQVGRASPSQWKKRSALNPGVANTLPPAASDDITAATSPWMWNSGMMLRQRSSAVRDSVRPMLAADAARLAWVSGTSFGRDVVPDVWSRSAMSPGSASAAGAGAPTAALSMRKVPAGPPASGTRRKTSRPRRVATSTLGPVSSFATSTALAPISPR